MNNDIINGVTIGDAGNSFSTAYQLSGSSTITGSAGGTDYGDLYKFTAASSGTASFALSGLGADLDLYLYNSAGSMVGYSERDGTVNESFSYSVVAGQTYYLAVDPYGSASSNYNLGVTLPAATLRQDVVNGVTIGDAGNSLSTAYQLSGNSTITGSAGGTDYGDLYKFTAASSGTASFALSGLGTNLDLYLYNSAVSLVGSSTNSGTANDSFSSSVVAGQTYYVYVWPPTSSGSNYNLGVTLPAAALPTLSIAAASANKAEGNSGTTPFTFTVSRSSGVGTSSVNWAVAHNTTSASDFSGLTSGTVSFASGVTTQTITLNVLGDTVSETDEAFTVNLSSAYGATIANSSATGTIFNDDVALRQDVVNGVTIGDAGNSLSTAYQLSGNSTITGSAGGTDYGDLYKFTAASSGTASFALSGLGTNLDLYLYNSAVSLVGSSTNSGTANDSFSSSVVAGQTYYVYVWPPTSSGSNYNLGVTLPAAALPTLSIAAASANKAEGNSGTTPFTFTVSRSSGVGTSSVNWAVAHNTTSASDFSGLTSGTVSFASGVTTQTITLNVLGDTVSETDEAFTVNLSSAYGATIANSSATGTIFNDDVALRQDVVNGVTIGDAGNSLSTAYQLSGNSTITGSAGGTDYGDLYKFTAASSGTASFALSGLGTNLDLYLYNSAVSLVGSSTNSGTANDSFSSSVVAGQTYYVYVWPPTSSGSNYNLGVTLPAAALPTLSIAAASANKAEGNSGTTPFTFTVSRSSGVGTSSVNWAVAHNTTSASDFSGLTSGTVSFASGVTTQTITLNVLGDTVSETDEAFTVNLSSAYGATIANSSATGTIFNDDVALRQDVVNGVTIGDAGNSLSTAYQLSGNSTITGSAGGTDYGDLYKFTAASSGTASFALSGLGTNLDLYLYNSAVSLVGSSTNSGTANDSFSSSVVAGQTYYVYVWPPTSSGSNYNLGVTLPAAALPTLSIAAASANKAEGNSGTTPFTFTVSRSSGVGTSSVNWAVAHNTTSASDFSGLTSGTVSFASGVTTQTITLNVLGDTVSETDEAFTVNLSSAYGATIANSSATGTIFNDDVALRQDVVNGVTIGDAGNSLSTAYQLSGNSTITGSAGGTDYGDLYKFTAASSGTASFALSGLGTNLDLYLYNSAVSLVGSSTNSGTANDSFSSSVVAGQTYYVYVWPPTSSGSNYNLGVTLPAAALPTLSIAAASANKAEGNSGTTPFTFTVSRSSGVGTSSVNWAVAHNTTSASDFSGLTSGTVSFASGVTTQTITLNVLGDTVSETDEAFTVNLSSAYGATIANSSATGTIFNDDVALRQDVVNGVTIGDAGNSLSTAYQLSGNSTITGSAGGTDYGDLYKFTAASSGTASFALSGLGTNLDLYLYNSAVSLVGSSTNSGTANDSFSSSVVAGQTYYVYVWPPTSSGSNYNLGVTLPAAALPTLSIAAASANKAEGNSGTTPFTFTVSRSSGVGTSSVNWAVAHNTTSASDFSGLTSGTVSFASGVTTQTITLNVLGDTVSETDEAFTVNLSSAYGATIANSSATGTIFNDDVALRQDVVNGVTIGDAGNSLSTAYQLSGNSTITGSAGGTDYGDLYKFTAASSGTASFALSGLGTNLDLYLYNSAVSLVGSSTNSGTANDSFSSSVVAGQTYYVYVWPPTSSGSNYNLGVTLPAAALPTLSIAAASANKAEGNSGTTPFTFTVSRSSGVGTSSVNWAVAHNTTSASDFSGLTSGTVSFASGVTTQTITLNVLGDTVSETDEAFTVNLSSAYGATIANSSATGTIFNDDLDTTAPTVTTFSPADGATGVAVGSNLVLTFSETIQKGAGTIALRSGSATGTIIESFDAATSSRIVTSGNTLIIDPTSDLASNTQYYLTFTAGTVKDLAGNAYAGTNSYDFTTINSGTVNNVFSLNSKPGSNYTIYLDFDGANLSGTAWGSKVSMAPAFSLDTNATNFSATELSAIREIFYRVAADFASFDVNVTTELPSADKLSRLSISDTVYGTTCLISPIGDLVQPGAGGIAYVGVFDDTNDYYKPALVFPEKLSSSSKFIAEAVSHEVGHNLNLRHDGTATVGYYTGQGSSPGWAPIMGVGYYKTLTQWSNGNYAGANNTENDISLISANGTSLIADDYSNTGYFTLARSTTNANEQVASGYISQNSSGGNDVDGFYFDAAAGQVSIAVRNALFFYEEGGRKAVNLPNGYGDLRIDCDVYDASGNIVYNYNPNNTLDAVFTFTANNAGRYFLKVDGTGKSVTASFSHQYVSIHRRSMYSSVCFIWIFYILPKVIITNNLL